MAQGFTHAFLRITEPLVFGRRGLTLAIIGVATLFLAYHAVRLEPDAGFGKQLPASHDYTRLFRKYQGVFGGTTRVFVALVRQDGVIYEASFLEALRKATDDVFFTAGIDRGSVTSLFTPNVVYAESQENGTLLTGTVVPPEYEPSAAMAARIRANVARTAVVGRLVALDHGGAMIWAEVIEGDSRSGRPDYLRVARALENIRGRIQQPRMREYRLADDYGPLPAGTLAGRRYRALGPLDHDDDAFEVLYPDADGVVQPIAVPRAMLRAQELPNPDYTPGIDVHVVGFAKAAGDIFEAALGVVAFFGVALLMMLVLLWAYCGSLRVAVLPMACAMIAVIWELGLLRLFGFGMDPYAILVPFLIAALAVSHGVQVTNFWLLEMSGNARAPRDASVATFRRLVVPGLTALVTNIVGFATLLLVPIGFVQEMAWNACFGCLGIIVSKKILLPILLSYARLPDMGSLRRYQTQRDATLDRVWAAIARLTEPRHAAAILVVAVALGIGFGWSATRLTIGEMRTDVAELRPDSRYNRDAAAIDRRFAGHRDVVLTVIAEGAPEACIDHRALQAVDDFAWHMANQPGVLAVRSLPQLAARLNSIFFETNPKWRVLPRNRFLLVQATGSFGPASGLANADCSAMPVHLHLRDHRADTIERAIAAVEAYRLAHDDAPVQLALATGNVGLLAASNAVVRASERSILLWVYAAIAVCVWVSFRSVASVVCILLPLALVSVAAYAAMVALGIGLKPTTLPIAAFAAGIGVDYGIYIYSVLHERMARGESLTVAYRQALRQTGKAVVFTALALTAGVGTWLASELQFQADMGALLALMFLGNMVGAVVLLPALAAFATRRGLPRT